MPTFGAHLSVAGGYHNAANEAKKLGMYAVQIFTKNANQWAAKPIPPEQVAAWKEASAGLKYTVSHDSYLINLAAQDDGLYQKSLAAFVVELERAELLGLNAVVTHPGAHVGAGEEAGVAKVIEGLNAALARTKGFAVRVLLEITAGQGSALGCKFEHIGTMIGGAAEPERIGVCFDTCHAFAAGYNLSTAAGYAATFEAFDRHIGVKKLELFHVNDSQKGLGSRVDRHAAIGEGMLGANAFRRLVNDPRFADRPMVLETPKEDDAKKPMDPVNLARLRGYVGEPVPDDAAPVDAGGGLFAGM